jgi:hypothetical protein
MNRYDPDRPSIFSKPEEDDVAATPARAHQDPPYGENPTVVTRASGPPRAPRPPRPAYAPERPDDPEAPRNVRLIVLGSMGIAILALGGFIAASILRPASDPGLSLASPEPSSSAIGVTASAGPSGTPSMTAEPTPEPTPAGPPQEVAVHGWATVTVGELNVRRSAGPDEASVYRLVEGAVVNVAEGPTGIDGANWYRVASLGGAAGWVSSGWIAEPYLETLVDDPTLIRCGKVMRPVFEVVDGSPRPNDPLQIGGLALPVAAFNDVSLGVIELLRGMDQEACFSAEVGTAGVPVVRTELNVGACGHTVPDGGFFRLRPAAGGNLPLSSQVKEPVVVHPSILAGGPPDDRKSSNIRSIVAMMANEGVGGCINASAVGGTNDVVGYRSADVSQCSIVHEYNAHSLKLTPAAGGEMAWIKLTSDGYQPGLFPLETPVSVGINAQASDDARSAYAWIAGEPGCG